MAMSSDVLSGEDGRFIVLAMDHGQLFGKFYEAMTDPGVLFRAADEGGADGVIMSFGLFKRFSDMLGEQVKAVLRLDGGPSKYCERWPNYTKWHQLYTASTAAELGVDAVIVMVFFAGEVEAETLRILARVSSELHGTGVAVVAEVIPCADATDENAYSKELVADAARACFELGADVVKTVYTGSPETFQYVTSSCPVPVGILGGPQMSNAFDVLRTAKGAMDGGAAGVFFGRNIWQYKDPVKMLRALNVIVHEHGSVEAAMNELGS